MTGLDGALQRTTGRVDSASLRHRVGVRRAETARAGDADLTVALDRARAGDDAAFTRVFRAVQPGLLRYLSALVGAEAEDVASETWSHACRDLASFRGDIDGFRGWVATIARHRAIDHLRARARRPADPVPVDELHGRPGGADTEGLALESLSTSTAMALIAALPQDQAEAVLLRAVMGLDAKTAGQVLGKRAGAVRSAAHRGLQTLSNQVETAHAAVNHEVTSRLRDIFAPTDADEVR